MDWKPFTRDELILQMHVRRDLDELPLIEIAEYNRRHLRSPHYMAVAHRGYKDDFESLLDFWHWSLLLAVDPAPAGNSNDMRGFGETALCEPIGANKYFEAVDQFAAILTCRLPDFLVSRDGFVGGMKMFCSFSSGLGFQNGCFGEFEDYYVAFHDSVPD